MGAGVGAVACEDAVQHRDRIAGTAGLDQGGAEGVEGGRLATGGERRQQIHRLRRAAQPGERQPLLAQQRLARRAAARRLLHHRQGVGGALLLEQHLGEERPCRRHVAAPRQHGAHLGLRRTQATGGEERVHALHAAVELDQVLGVVGGGVGVAAGGRTGEVAEGGQGRGIRRRHRALGRRPRRLGGQRAVEPAGVSAAFGQPVPGLAGIGGEIVELGHRELDVLERGGAVDDAAQRRPAEVEGGVECLEVGRRRLGGCREERAAGTLRSVPRLRDAPAPTAASTVGRTSTWRASRRSTPGETPVPTAPAARAASRRTRRGRG